MKALLWTVVFLAAGMAQPAVITWTNTGSGSWGVASNWNPNQVPTTNDTAVISGPGSYTVTLNTSPTLSGLAIGGAVGTQTLATAGRTLFLNGEGAINANGRLLLSGGALSGTSRVHLGGAMTWQYGGIDTNASVLVEPAGHVTIASGGKYAKFLYGSLTNDGVVSWQPLGSLSLGGTLHNLAGGIFDAQTDDAILKSGSSGIIVNDGVFRKSAGAGTLDCQVPLVNRGTVETQTGRLLLADGSVFNAGCEFIGSGETRLDSGTNTIQGAIHSENLSLLYNATLAGTGSVSGVLTWGGGSIGEGARITVATNGQLLIASAANFGKNLNGHLLNAGTITWQTQGGLYVKGVLHILPGGLFDAQLDGAIFQGGGGLVINDGVFRKSSGTGATACGVPLINNGTVETETGAITLSDGSVFNEGCAFTGAGVARFSSGTNWISGTIRSENLALLYNATLAGTGGFSGTLTWSGGAIGPEAAITIATNGELVIASTANYAKYLLGSLTNAGRITWQPQGSLWNGGVLHNLSGGAFDGRFDGTIFQSNGGLIINDGVFRKSAGTGTTACVAPFINNGTAEILSGTLAFDGDYTNPLGTIALAGGAFRTAQPLWLPNGLLTGWGTVRANVTNAACVRPSSSNGLLRIDGTYEQLLGGRMEFEIGGDLPGTNQSQLSINGPATLRGTAGVVWKNGYVPAPDTSFPVLTFASHWGEFSCFDNLFLLGHGLRLAPGYTETNLILVGVAAPDPTNVPLRIAVNNGALVAWPIEFSGFDLYWNTNLNFTNWTLIPGITNRYFEPAPLAPEKYFLLRPRNE